MNRTIGDGGGPIERKVQVTGGSTYTVSIPKAWANARDIGSGSTVNLYPFDDRLVITQPNGSAPKRRAQINVDTLEGPNLTKRIQAAYAAGVDEIVVESDTGFDSTQRRRVGRSVTELIGIEIATESDREILATSLLDPSEISLEDTIDQLRRIALSMHENAITAVIQPDSSELAEHVVSRDDDADRLFALVSRQFYRSLTDVQQIEKLRTNRQIAFTRFRTARQLERIADHAERIAALSYRQAQPPSKPLAKTFESVSIEARRVVRTALDGNTGEALLRRDDVLEKLEELDREIYTDSRDDRYLYGRLLQSIKRTAEYGGNIAEIHTLANITESQAR